MAIASMSATSRWSSAPDHRRGPVLPPALRIATLTALLVLPLGAPESGEPLPYRVAIDIAYGTPRGPDTVRRDLQNELRLGLAASGCFRSVVPLAEGLSDSDLLLRVTLGEYHEGTSHDLSIGSQSSANTPTADRRMVATASARIVLEILTADLVPVRARQFHQRSSYRPLVGESLTASIRAEFVSNIVDKSAKMLCKGSPKQWEKAIVEARREAGDGR